MITYSIDVNPNLSTIVTACSNAERIVAIQIMKDTKPYVPALTMSLNNRTRAIGKTIYYPGPYARYLYFGKRMVNSATGKGPRYIPDVGWRWPRGATLVPTNQPLHYTTSVHEKAGAKWMDRSAKDNIHTWEEVARRAVAQYGR